MDQDVTLRTHIAALRTGDMDQIEPSRAAVLALPAPVTFADPLAAHVMTPYLAALRKQRGMSKAGARVVAAFEGRPLPSMRAEASP